MKSLSRRVKMVLRGILIVSVSGSFAGVPVLHAEEPAQPNEEHASEKGETGEVVERAGSRTAS